MHVQLTAMVLFYTATTLIKPSIGCLIDSGASFRSCLRVAAICGGSGGLLYAVAGDVSGGMGVPLLLAARFVGGGGNAMSTLANVYAVKALQDPATKNEQLSLFAASTLVGVFVGPSIVPVFARINVTLGAVRLDQCTLPGWFLFVVFLLLLLLEEAVVLEPPRGPPSGAATSAVAKALKDDSAAAAAAPAALANTQTVGTACCEGWLMRLTLIFGLTFAYAVNMFSIIAVLAAFTEEVWGWGPVPNAFLFLALAAFTLVGVLVSSQLLKAAVQPLDMLTSAALLLLCHLLLVAVWHGVIDRLWSFLLWAAVCGVSYAALNACNAAAVASIAPPARVGFCLGLLGLVDSIGSALAPVYIGLFGLGSASDVPIRDGLVLSRLPMIPVTALLAFALAMVAGASRSHREQLV